MIEKTLTITYYREVLRNEDDFCITTKNKDGSDRILAFFSGGVETAKLYNFLTGRSNIFYGHCKE